MKASDNVNELRKEFDDFVKIIKDGLKKGTIKISEELTDLDYAVTFAIGKIGERKGYPYGVTADEIGAEIMKFAPELSELGGEENE